MDIVARRYDTQELVCIHVEDGQIRSIQPQATAAGAAAAPWVGPGLVAGPRAPTLSRECHSRECHNLDSESA